MDTAVTPPVETPETPDTSLADHEAQFAPGATPAPEPADDAEPEPEAASSDRDEKGRFKPERHRAQSQRATPDDVAAIAAQTKRLREAEESFGIEKQPGESDRVYQLRRRAEIAERAKAPRATPPPAAVPRATPPPPPVAAATPPKPDPEKFTYGTADPDFLEALSDWKTDRKFEAWEASKREAAAAEQQAAEHEKIATGYATRVTEAKTRYPDFETVAFGTPEAALPPLLRRGTLAEAFIFEAPSGLDVLYHLLTPANRPELERLSALSGVELVVELSLLGQRLTTPSRVQAGTTGSAAPSPSSPAPRPPNPVRTGPMKSADEPPGDDDMSIDSHERYFGSLRHR